MIAQPSAASERPEPPFASLIVEELLRAYSPVTMARYVAEDTEYKGCPMSEGSKVLMNFPAANRDPRVFEHPEEVDLHREKNPHIAFGHGVHLCLGLHLARLEIRILFEELLPRLNEIELTGAPKNTRAAFVSGLKSLPIRYRLR